MSNKYVPRFMAKVAPAVVPSAPSVTPAPSAPSVAPAVTPSRWTKDEDIYRISPKKQNLINTSLPAKMAPTLAPATLSALTAQEKRTPLKVKEVALSSEDEFPSLGGKKVAKEVKATQATKSFSELSKSWATTQKEDEAKAKEEEKEALRLQQLQQAKEAEEFVRGGVQNLSVRTKHLRYVNQRADDEDDGAR